MTTDARDIAVVLLAAGQGSRMNSDIPKVLHKLGGVPLVWHALNAVQTLEPARIVVVTGHGAETVEKSVASFDSEITCIRQMTQDGTAHAVAQAEAALDGFKGDVVVLYGDTPFVSPQTLENLCAARDGSDIVVLGFEAADPGRYGRLVTNGNTLEKIVEAKDASPAELAITTCNSGVVMADRDGLFALIDKVGNDNAAQEYYLTDIVGIARDGGQSASVVMCDEDETLGINTRAELAKAEQSFQARARLAALEDGVSLQDPATTYFSFDTVIGRDTTIGANTVFGPGVTIESGAEIRPFCHLEGCHVSQGAIVGPFARLRPGAELQENTHVGNFVEIKNAVLSEGAKVNHLSYVGDADIGAGTNIGAGTITCNYDGVMKHRTTIGANAFIGSNTLLVAPVTVGDEAMTGSGTVVTQDIEPGALAIARARQVNKPGLAVKLMDMLRRKKATKEA